MATLRTSAAGGASSGTSDRTVTIVPAIGDLLVVYACVAANTNDTPTCSDNNGGGTYDRIDVMNFAISTVNYRLSVFVRTALMTNTTSTIITIATGSNTSGATVALAIQNITKTGSAAVRSKGSQNNQAAGTPAPALNQTSLTGNLTIVALGSADTTTTEPSGWTEAQDTSQINDSVSLEVATRNSGFTGTTITFGAASSTQFASHALELDSVLSITAADSVNGAADAVLLGRGLAVSDNSNNLTDSAAKTLGSVVQPLTQSVADSLNFWNDSAGGSKKSRWLDASATNLQAAGPTPLTQGVSDSLNFWSDSVTGDNKTRWVDSAAKSLSGGAVQIQIQASDSMSQTDSLQIGPGLRVSDSFTLTDGTASLVGVEYSVEAAEDLDNWADAQTVTRLSSALTLSVSDSLNFWADSLTTGRTLSVSDSLNNWVDLATGSKKLRWLDVASKTLSGGSVLSISVSDSLNFWADTLLLGRGLAVSDSLTQSDSLLLGIGLRVTEDANNLTDNVNKTLAGALINLTVGDDLNNWQDAVTKTLNYSLTTSDNLNNWSDSLALGHGLRVSDTVNNWIDALLLGRGLAVSDNANNFTDAVSRFATINLVVAESLNNWAEFLLLGHGFKITDNAANLADAIVVTSGTPFLTLSVSDSLNNWQDAATKNLSSTGLAVWQNLGTVTLNAVSLGTVTLLTENLGDDGDVMFEDTDTIALLTEDVDAASINLENTGTATINYEDIDTV